MSELLKGVRVIESSTLLNGATTAMMLADMGADVIKVESPFLGDYIRLPYTMHMHTQVNRNKRSVAIDLRHDAGRSVFARLLATADVFVTNAPGKRNEKLGLSFEQLRAIKPDIVYCQNTGFGATGPYSDLPVHGQMMDCLAGALPVEMGPEGLTRPHMPPTGRTGTMMVGGEGTATGSVYAAMHVAAGLVRRSMTGEGCYLDVSSAESVIANAWTSVCAALNAPPSRRGFLSRTDVARYQFYETKDSKFVLFCPEETKFWHSFCEVMGRLDLKDRDSGVDLRRELQSIFASRDRTEWVALAIEHGWPLGPVNNSLAEVTEDPQIRSRGVFNEETGPDGRPFVYVEQPVHVGGQQHGVARPAPSLGEHTADVLHELGYAPEEIEALRVEQVTEAAARDAVIPPGLAEL